VSDIQPELWVEHPAQAIAFYQAAFGAIVTHRVGDGEDVVAQLAVGNARFWIATADPENERFHPAAIGGGTSRTLLVVDDPDAVMQAASSAGAIVTSPVGDEHGWRLGRITTPCGHRWEIGKPIGSWPPP
jgi:PhnB protein